MISFNFIAHNEFIDYMNLLLYSDKESIFYTKNRQLLESKKIPELIPLFLSNNYDVIFLKKDGKYIGSCSFQIKSEINEIHVFSVYIIENERGRGHTEQLFSAYLIDYANKINIKKIIVGKLHEKLTEENKKILGILSNMKRRFKGNIRIEQNIIYIE